MKKLLTISTLLILLFAGSSAYSQAGNSGNSGWGTDFSSGSNQFNETPQNSPIPMNVVVAILQIASDSFQAPQGVLLQAYFRGQLTIVLDPFINAYVVSYSGNQLIINVGDL